MTPDSKQIECPRCKHTWTHDGDPDREPPCPGCGRRPISLESHLLQESTMRPGFGWLMGADGRPHKVWR